MDAHRDTKGTTPSASSPSPAPNRRLRGGGHSFAERYGVVAFLILMIVGFSIALPGKFATDGNFRTMIESQAVLVMLAIAASVPLRAGDFDLSIASTMTVSGAVAAQLLSSGESLLLVIPATLAVGLLVGCINGFIVVRIGVDSFITTLGTMTALTGLTYAISNSEIIYGFDGGALSIARTELLGLPLIVWYGWAVVAIAWYVFERTAIGRYLLFVGGGRDVARLAGVPADRVRFGAFLASGTISALAGFLLIGLVGALDPTIGPSYLLQPFAAAFLGATIIHVGRFNAVGTLLALYLLTVGITGLQLLGAEGWVNELFYGVALVLAVVTARLMARVQTA